MKMLIKLAIGLSTGLSLAVLPVQGTAALQQGAKAPDFTLSAALAGKPIRLSLSQMLKKGPVVLYFFPAAFTPGCTVEAHLFAEASGDFNKLGARIIGVTAGNIDRRRAPLTSWISCASRSMVAASASHANMKRALPPMKV